jgi:carbamoylphosphate synthase large subunit
MFGRDFILQPSLITLVKELPRWTVEEFSSTIRQSTGRMIGCGGVIYCGRRLRSDVAVLRIEAADRYFMRH